MGGLAIHPLRPFADPIHTQDGQRPRAQGLRRGLNLPQIISSTMSYINLPVQSDGHRGDFGMPFVVVLHEPPKEEFVLGDVLPYGQKLSSDFLGVKS